uniref:Uncharacterized protein n=1 Tax=Staphylococcus epidermidis TaxID=1282 RepID=D2JC21_STAEP|nr:hypothetical protein SAP105A_017 [Staphylococcus epidermidis]
MNSIDDTASKEKSYLNFGVAFIFYALILNFKGGILKN